MKNPADLRADPHGRAPPCSIGKSTSAGRLGRIANHLVYKIRIVYRKRTPNYFDAREMDPRVTLAGPKLGFHYMFHPKSVYAHLETDDQGFSVICVNGQWRRQPLTHCHMTMRKFYEYLQTGDAASRQRFLDAVELLRGAVRTVQIGGATCDVLYYDFEMALCAPHPVPWICCMSQAWAMSLFCRAYQASGREDYLAAARRLMAVFTVPVAQGGLLDHDSQGHVYYEEYPFPGQTVHVLNGFMSSLMGLYDLYRATGDAEAKRLFDQGIATLAADGVLERYDIGYCSVYDQACVRKALPAYPRYNLVHVRQLTVLHRITGIELFREIAERWYAYSRSPWCRFRCLLDSVAYRLRNLPRYIRDAVQA